jgi:hypothetical protein
MAETGTDTFSAFSAYGHGDQLQRSWTSSLLASSSIYVLVGLLIAALSATKTIVERKKAVEVKFVEKVVKEPPPPGAEDRAGPAASGRAPGAGRPAGHEGAEARQAAAAPEAARRAEGDADERAEGGRTRARTRHRGVRRSHKGDPAGMEGGMAARSRAPSRCRGRRPAGSAEANDKPAYPQERARTAAKAR